MSPNSVIGIVAEYNPWHKGHSYQISLARKILGDAPVVAVMSGSFTQRGSAALLDKWTRAGLAIAGGVDLVLELPVIYACRSSEQFARGAVGTLAGTGVITHLAFGTETDAPELLAELAQEKIAKNKFKEYLKAGLTYGAAMEKTLGEKNTHAAKLLKGPNNILALEYYRTLNNSHTDIVPLPLVRRGAGYNETKLGTALPSAAAIREELLSHGFTPAVKNALPDKVSTLLGEILQLQTPGINAEKFALLLSYFLRSSSPKKIKAFCDCSEGLENKIAQGAKAHTLEEIVASIKSKRYPATRINRLLCQLLISTEEVPFPATAKLAPSYIRVLAFNNRGRKLLRKMKNTASLPIITKLGKNIFQNKENTPFALTLKTEIAATNLYDLLAGNGGYNRDFTQQPYHKQIAASLIAEER